MPFAVLILLCLIGFETVRAQLPTGVTLVPFYDTTQVSLARDSVRTVGMAEVPGKPEHFLVLDQRGAVHSLFPDTTLAYAAGQIKRYTKAVVADFRGRVKQNLRGEMGAWSLAMSPDFTRDRSFYILYFGYNTIPSDAIRSDGHVNLERWVLGADYRRATLDTTVFSFYHEPSYGVSSMAFGPDGLLYLATSVYSEDGWDTTSLARKILRIDVAHPGGGRLYSIPPGNPFANHPDPKVRKEIYAWGLRNVWTMAFDFRSGNLWAGDVGQDLFEEINLIKPGRNYGWADGGNSESSANGYGAQGKCPVGFSVKGVGCSGLADPDWSFSHTTSPAINCIVVGPAYRGDPASPFYGYHIVTDVQRGVFWALKEGGTPQMVGQAPGSLGIGKNAHNGIVNFAEDSRSNLYALLVSWHFPGSIGGTANPLPEGERMFHEIYRLSHAGLRPGPATRAFRGPGLPARPPADRLIANLGAAPRIDLPAGYSSLELRDLRGRRIPLRREAGGAVMPPGPETGIMHARFLP